LAVFTVFILGIGRPLGMASMGIRVATRVLAILAVLAVSATPACAPPLVGSVGAVLGKDVHSGRLFVREVPPGMAAAVAGVRDGDEVIAIDGVPVSEMSPVEVHHRLEGEVGSKVVLLVVRNGESQKIEVVRGPFAKP
jgi:S1-C subfamily serine protease